MSFPGDGRIGAVPGSLVPDQITLNGSSARLRSSTASVSFTANRGITLGASGGGFDHASTVTLTWAGPITGSSGGGLTMSGAGVLILSSTANNYDGPTTISAGTLQCGASGVIPDTSVVNLTAAGVTFSLNGFDETVKSIAGTAGTFALGGNTLTVANPAGETYLSVISSTAAGKFVKNGTGALTLGGASSGFLGEFVINNGTIGVSNSSALGAGAAGSSVSINGGKLSNTGTSGRTIPATASVNLNGDFAVDDSLFFSSTPGQILFNGAATIKNGNRTINVASVNGQIPNLGFGGVVGQDVAGRGIIKNGAGTLALTAINTYSGDTTINAGQININSTSTLGDGTGTLHLSGGKLNSTASRSAGSAPVPNPIDLTADSYITTSSTANPVELNLSSSVIGGSAGTLIFSNANNSASGLFNPRFSGGGFTFSQPIVIANGNAGSTNVLNSYNTTGTDQTFSGVISGNGSYVRNASTAGTGGRTIFTAANTYSGGTTVSRGTLLVNNTTGSGTGSGTVTVGSDGTLGGTGTISGAVTVSGTLAPGTSIGTLTFGSSLTLSGTTSMEINKTLGTADKIVTSIGTVTLGGNLTAVNLAGTLALNDTFDLIDGTIAGAFSSFTLPTLPAGLAWDTSQLTAGGNGTIKVVCDGTLTASAGANQTICLGSSVAIGGSPTASGGSGSGYTYLWSPATGLNDATLANPTASPSSTTSYTVTVTDANGCTATSSSVTVTVNTAPSVSSGPSPSSQTVCDGSAASITVSAAGTSPTYAWRKLGTGWGTGNQWQLSGAGGNGGFFIGDSANNGSGSSGNINTSGKAWGMYANGGNTVSAVRSFTGAGLAVGQTFQIDMDNGFIDNGSTVGFGLQNSSGQNVWEFFFVGGGSSYTVNAGSVTPTPSIPFTADGLRIALTLTAAGTYSVTITTPVGGSSSTFTGSLLSPGGGQTITQLRLFNANAGNGSANDAYFNGIIAGAYDDNAANYTAWNNGDNFGDSPLSNGGNIAGANTATLTITPAGAGDAASYDVVLYNSCGQASSGVATLTLNPRPTSVVRTADSTTICNGGSTTIHADLTGTGPWNVTWSDAVTQTGVSTSPATRNVSPSSTTVYTVTALTDANCAAQPGDLTGSATITVNPRPTAVVSGDATICNGQSTVIQAVLTGAGPWDVTWSDAVTQLGVLSSPATRSVSPASTTTYTVTALVDANCTALPGDLTGSATVSVNPRPTSVVSGSTPICPGGSANIQAVLTGTGPWSVQWSDEGSPDTVLSSPAMRTVSPGTTTTYTVTILSDANCTALPGDRTGSATVTLEDTAPPIITCATNKTVECGSVWTFDAPSASDTCCGTNVTIGIVDTTTNGTGCSLLITRTWQATDCNSNSATCSQIVTVVDTTAPVINCATNKTVECGSAWSFDDPSALDACSGTNLTVGILSTVTNGTACSKDITRTWQATDPCTNSSTCSQTVTVVDTTPPNITCASDKTAECGSVWGFDEPSANDACCGTNVIISIVDTVTNGSQCAYSVTRTWLATDCCGNTNSCSQNVTVSDNTPPVLTCATNKTVQCTDDYHFDPPSVFDACCGNNVSLDELGDVFDGGGCHRTVTRTWQATDCCSNSITCTQTITIIDTTPPVITCATNKTALCGDPWSFDDPTAEDACCPTVSIIVLGTVTNGSACSLQITRTWQATDCCSNSATCSQIVTVVDTTAPVITCVPNKTVGCSSGWSFDEPSALDACSGTNLTLTILNTVTNSAYPMVLTRTWQATDLCTNSSTCSQSVTLTNSCAAPAITAVNYSGTTFSLSFLGQSGLTYDIEYKNALDDPSWTLLESDPGTGAIITVNDSSATPGTRFYRVICRCQ
jgi:autotransporter-associated beta strand protein